MVKLTLIGRLPVGERGRNKINPSEQKNEKMHKWKYCSSTSRVGHPTPAGSREGRGQAYKEIPEYTALGIITPGRVGIIGTRTVGMPSETCRIGLRSNTDSKTAIPYREGGSGVRKSR
jgi:hypothetical protein